MRWGGVVCDEDLFDEGLEGGGVDVVGLVGFVGLVGHFGFGLGGFDVGFCCFRSWVGCGLSCRDSFIDAGTDVLRNAGPHGFMRGIALFRSTSEVWWVYSITNIWGLRA